MASKRNGPMNGYYALRWAVLERDKFTCQYCGQSAPNTKLEVDHVVTVEDGGTDDMANLKTACYSCNRGRSGLTIRLRRGKGRLAKGYAELPSIRQIFRREPVAELLKTGPKTIGDIAKHVNCTRANVSVIMSRMVKAGQAKRVNPGVYTLP